MEAVSANGTTLLGVMPASVRPSWSATLHALRRFDALGLVHKVDIDGSAGKVSYLSRKLNRGTEAFISEEGVMPPNGGTFAQPPATGLVGRALAGVAGAEACLFEDGSDGVFLTRMNLLQHSVDFAGVCWHAAITSVISAVTKQ